MLPDVQLHAGDNRHTIVLTIANVEDQVTVAQDPLEAASDRRGASFDSALTREQIDALPDDPEEMTRQLPDVQQYRRHHHLNSFEGAALPPKAVIRSIRLTRDAFAAENHNAAAFAMNIDKQPGLGTFGGSIQSRFRNGALSGRSAFTPANGAEMTQDYGVNLGGPVIADRTSFNVYLQGMTSFDSSNLNVALPGAKRSEALALRTRRDRLALSSNFDHALRPTHALCESRITPP